jgi:membrane-associated phospholipid phosphatase
LNQTSEGFAVVAVREIQAEPLLDQLDHGIIRKSEYVILGFLVYAVILAAALPAGQPIRHLVTMLNAGIFIGYAALLVCAVLRPKLVFALLRDTASMALIILAYREMGWFAQPHSNHALEGSWVAWDRAVLRGGARAVIESLGPVIPSILEVSYALVYALAPFAVFMLYLYKRRDRVDQFLFVFAVGVLLCYGQFPFWPSDPPRVIFAGEDVPSYFTVFRRFNLWTLGNYGIHTSVFPSAHVAGAFAAAFGAFRTLPEHRWVGRLLLTIACLIAVATIYGRYHYIADAGAGLAVAVVAARVTANARLLAPGVVEPIVRRVSRASLATSLQQTAAAVRSHSTPKTAGINGRLHDPGHTQ